MSEEKKVQDVFLTPELEKMLKGSVGMEIDVEFKYVPKEYRVKEKNEFKIDKKLWPVFTLKSKNGLEIAKVEDETGFVSYDEDGNKRIQLKSGALRIGTLKAGILSIKGFLLSSTKKINYNLDAKKTLEVIKSDGSKDTTNDVDIEEVLKYIKAPLQVELQDTINEKSELSAEELLGLE